MTWKPSVRAALAEYEKFFNLSVDLLCIAGFDGYFKLLNPAWEKTLGYTLDELRSRPYREFVHPEDRDSTGQEAGKLASGDPVLSFDNRYLAKGGAYRWLHWTAVPVQSKELIYAVARDVTERREAEEALAKAKAAAEQANRAKGEFVASMSHELRTPLNSVIGFSDVLLADAGDRLTDSETDYLRRIRANGERLLSLINQVLDLEKVEAGKPTVEQENIGLTALAQDVAAEFEHLVAAQGNRLEIEVQPNLRPIHGDYEKLRGVLVNLIGNAVKFTEKGVVKIRVLPFAGSRQPAAVEIIDTGIGIPADKLESIFDPFEQIESGSSKTFQGSGLGLAISRAQCELMGYELEVESELGVGSTFRIRLGERTQLPRETGDRESQALALSLVHEFEAERVRRPFESVVVLVIDNDADARLVSRRSLRSLGCQVLTAATGLQGFRLAREHSPDLITIDLALPSTGVDRLIDLLSQDRRLSQTPLVAVSSAGPERRPDLPQSVEIIEKPIHTEKLRRALSRNLPPPVGRVLLVDPDRASRERLAACLEPGSSEWRQVGSGREARAELERYTPDLALIDLGGEEKVGAMLVAEMRLQPRLEGVPVVMVTAGDLSSTELERIGRESGPVVRKGRNLEGDLRELCWALRRGKEDSKV